jgi:hypothetical protein
MKATKLFVLFILASLQIGCCIGGYVPLPHTKAADVEIDYSFIHENVTTKEDIILQFGNPRWASSDEKEIIYIWARVYGYWGVLLYPFTTGGGGTHRAEHCVYLEFDDKDIVKNVLVNSERESLFGTRPTYDVGDENLAFFLRDGYITKHQIIWWLGAPLSSDKGGRLLIYDLEHDAVVYRLVVVFDENNLLSRHALIKWYDKRE